ncbi:hypothetical protein A3D05_06025 [Candidatus Gottesmanbacteria bacterium RIFCSPHIGHO2_02_FULL_40_24]|nr:MAG: hypothetical protein A3D05_06025 [Candidatus Gottesmanbacteria bacterium RIFCSPHIGHO2_02_FULL_40_24]OGG23115.1 MAG: hypothetical protein A3E42_04120 [Candidatus Gottesmanbacteria bacterium RIFCSPHIGHO2_12_FULL_40_13]
MNYKLNIAWLYPDLMSTYGDRGNIICLTKRCRERAIDVTVKYITLETNNLSLPECNLIFMGGAQDRQQKLASEDFLRVKAPVIKTMVENNIPALFVCAAYQAAGHYYRPYKGKDIKGASIFDLVTVHPGDQAKRLIGNVAARLLVPSEIKGELIIGFENHGGRTTLGNNIKPLAKVISGRGNNGRDLYEGALYKNAVGSYFHGPILPKNPVLADWLIKKAVEIKYGKKIKLALLNDNLADLARKSILRKMNINYD